MLNGSGTCVNQDMGLAKVGHNDLVLWQMTWGGEMHALLKFEDVGLEFNCPVNFIGHFEPVSLPNLTFPGQA